MKGKFTPVFAFWVAALSLSRFMMPVGKAADAAPAAATVASPAKSNAITAALKPGQPFTVSLPENATLDFVPIKPGKFLMGSPDSEAGRLLDEGPQHEVTISKDFWLGKYPVTQAQFQAVTAFNPSVFKTDPNLPVEYLTWDDATAFCAKLTEQEQAAGRLPAGYAYQLPTEAQWEFACRAGTTTPYAGTLDDLGWYDKNSGGATHPVGQKKPNAWGLYDMHGNVYEWCVDKYAPYAADPATDPVGVKGQFRILRGGSFYSDVRFCRSAARYSAVPGGIGGNSGLFVSSIVGFRVALAPKAN